MSSEDRDQLKNKIIDILRNEEKPTTVDYVSYKIGRSWSTAKSALLELALAQRIRALETTKGYVFWVDERQVE